jgi:hypothetical protein
MLQTKLITRAKVQQYKQVSNSVYDDVFDSILIQTQIEDIAPLLGEDLFNDLINNPANYTALLTGGAYTYNGITYQNYGLEAVIAYYWYARYTMFGNVTDTPFGLMQKISGEGTQEVSQKAKDALYQYNQNSAFTIWKSVENYLIRTNNILFNSVSLCQIKQKNNFNISKIV